MSDRPAKLVFMEKEPEAVYDLGSQFNKVPFEGLSKNRRRKGFVQLVSRNCRSGECLQGRF